MEVDIYMESVFRSDFTLAQYLAVDKKSFLKEMADLLAQKKVVNSADDFFKVIWARENVMSTGIGRAVALPHGCDETVVDFVVTVCQLAEPLPYDSIDQKPVSLVFLLAVPPSRQSNYMKLLAAISNFIRTPGNLELLLKAETKEEIFNQISKIKVEF